MFCPSFRSEIIHPLDGLTDLNTRRSLEGSRLFNEVSYQARAVENKIGSPEFDPKRLPSRRRFAPPSQSPLPVHSWQPDNKRRALAWRTRQLNVSAVRLSRVLHDG